nr:site-specific DNA-methyltransferase [uncultured Eisenbergiella sp.]
MSVEANKTLCGDALAVLKTLPADSVHCCVTSPPYYGLRDYGVAGQIGLEETPGEYVARLTAVFREVRRVLAADGTLWVNIADSYASHRTKGPGIKPKDLIGIPWMLALSLRADGWYLRSDIIWRKLNCMPHSVKDRPVSCYEHVFLLAKSKSYYFDYEALQTPVAGSSKERYRRGFNSAKYTAGAPGQAPQTITQARPGAEAPALRRGRDVWDIGTNNYRAAHFATYPVALVLPCILAGCPEDGIVLDPFFGAGTTGVAALELGRRYIGIELNPEYCKIADQRIAERSG